MSQQYKSDFKRGYDYARQRHAALLAEKNSQDIMEIAMAFFLTTGDTAEVARGIGTYYQEIGLKRRHCFRESR